MIGEVLVVDDEPDILNLTKLILEKEGYRVKTAINSLDFDEKINEDTRLVIIDDVMPGKQGIEICRDLKRDKNTSHIPVIVFSASGSIEKKEAALKAGAQGFLLKPFTINELTSIVRKYYHINK